MNTEVLKQFATEGLSINEGIAINATLVYSDSQPISNDQINNAPREKTNAWRQSWQKRQAA